MILKLQSSLALNVLFYITIICDNRSKTKIRLIAICVIFIVLKSSRNKNFQVWRPIFLDFLVNLEHETVKSGP